MKAQVGQFLLGCKFPVSRGLSCKNKTFLVIFPRRFSFKMSFNCFSVDSLALWMIPNEEDAVLTPKTRGENFSSGFLHSEFFGGGVSLYTATPLIVALSPDHTDIIRFRPWSPIATGNHLDRVEKIPGVRRLAPLTFLIRVQAFRDPLRRELPHVEIFKNDGPNPLT